MMNVYKTLNKEIQEIVLAKVTCETVIEGLNGYFASEPRNDYITVRAIFDNQDFILYDPEAWADILIAWLRTKHEIFYYPGMEAKHIMMNKGALNSLKWLYKNITGEEAEPNSYALIAPTISCNFSNKDKTISLLKEQNELLKDEIRRLNGELSVNNDEGVLNSLKQLYVRVIGTEPQFDSRTLITAGIEEQVSIYKIQIKELKERITELEANFKAVCDEDDIFRTRALKAEAELATKWTKTSLINWLQQRAQHKNVELDDSFLYSDDAWYDWTDIIDFLFDEIVKMRKEIENATYCLETDTVHDGAELTEQVVETVCKDIMTYIRQESSRYGFELPKEIDDTPLTVETIAYNPPSVRNTIAKIISDYVRSRNKVDILETRIKSIFDKHKSEFTVDEYVTNDPTIFFMLDCISAWLKSSIGDVKRYRAESRDKIEKYQLSLKDYILQGIEKRGYPCDGLQTKSIGEIVDWIVSMATCARNDLEDVKKETKNECYLYLWNALKNLNPDCDALKIDRYEYLVDRIFYELNIAEDNCKQCRRRHTTEKFDYIRRTNKAEEELKKLKNAEKP